MSEPKMPQDFQVRRRCFGHWDIYTSEGRVFCIRGGPSAYIVRHEKDSQTPCAKFKTVQACMGYITDQLMFELIIAEGQDFEVIEKWNV